MTPYQLPLLPTPPSPRVHLFPGPAFDREKDGVRLTKQRVRIIEYMSDGLYHTIAEIAAACQCSENSASAQLRHLRKPPPLGINATIGRKRDEKVAGLNWYRWEGV